MWSLLRSGRWIAFTLLVITAIVAFGLLSRWQWSRAEEHRTQRLELLAESQAAPVSWSEAMQHPSEWMPVTVTGRYAPDSTVLVRQRPLNGSNGFWVASKLIANGSAVWVLRGWTPVSGAATQAQAAPAPPMGDVTVTGRLRPDEPLPQPVPTDLPAGQVPVINVFSLGSTDGYYLERVTSSPADSVTPLPPPEVDEGRNISYAVQWILFAVVAIVGWFFFLRREAAEDARQAANAEATGGDSDGPRTA